MKRYRLAMLVPSVPDDDCFVHALAHHPAFEMMVTTSSAAFSEHALDSDVLLLHHALSPDLVAGFCTNLAAQDLKRSVIVTGVPPDNAFASLYFASGAATLIFETDSLPEAIDKIVWTLEPNRPSLAGSTEDEDPQPSTASPSLSH